jgi:3-dehydroshikimate dehydratase
MVKLAAFADEIGPNLDDQIRVCKANGVTHFELRGVYGRNVMDFEAGLRNEIKSKLDANGLGVAAIGSPIGKVAIDKPWSEHFDRFKRAVELAEFFSAPFVRLFSYYPAGGEGKGRSSPTGTKSSTGSGRRSITSGTTPSRSCTKTKRASTARKASSAWTSCSR